MTIKNKFFATTATAALVASAFIPVASAADLKDADQIPTWAQEAVEALVNEKIIQGDQNGYFNPKGIVSRAQAAEILYKAKELSTEGTENFSDVDADDWFYKAVVATSKEGIFEGNDKGEFKPKDALTREQAAAVIVRAFDLTGEADLSKFADAKKVSGWAKEAMAIAVENGVIKGDGTSLNPLNSISRAEIAVMVNRVLEATGTTDEVAAAKAALETAIATAEAVETTGKTAESVQALETAIAAAKAVVANSEATAEQLTTAKADVEAAVAGLVNTEEPVDEVAVAKAALEKAITDAEAVETTGKTAESVQALETAITAAKAVVANEDATAEQLTTAKADVEAAVAGLVDEETVEGVAEITSAVAYAPNSIAELMGLFSEYKVEGTVADEAVTELVLTFTDVNGVEVTETVAVTDGKFSETFASTKFDFTIKSVSFKNGEEVVSKNFETVVK